MIKRLISDFLEKFGLIEIKRKRVSKSLIVLCYHKITDTHDDLDQDIISATSAQFEEQINYLSKNYKVISIRDLVDNFDACFDGKSVLLTFDDGYLENYSLVYPILKRYSVPGTFFVPTGYIGSKEYFWWDRLSLIINSAKMDKLRNKLSLKENTKKKILHKLQKELKRYSNEEREVKLKELEKKLGIKGLKPRVSQVLNWRQIIKMSKEGMYFAPHTVTHPILSAESADQVDYEISNSKKILELKLNQKIPVFCYPNGQAEDINDYVVSILKKYDVLYSFTTSCGKNSRTCDKLKIKRFMISKNMGFSAFKAEIEGLFCIPWIK